MTNWLVHKFICGFLLQIFLVCNPTYVMYGLLFVLIFAMIWISTIVAFLISLFMRLMG